MEIIAKSRYNRRNSDYSSYGSLAYSREPSITRHTKRDSRRRKDNQSKAINIANLKHSAMFLLSIVIIFAGCIATMVPHAMVAEQERINNNLKNELNEIRNENTTISAEIANKVNLEYVEQEAKSRLGMREPQGYQITYIDVPKQSYSVQYDVNNE